LGTKEKEGLMLPALLTVMVSVAEGVVADAG
jgi:hypothetical protein